MENLTIIYASIIGAIGTILGQLIPLVLPKIRRSWVKPCLVILLPIIIGLSIYIFSSDPTNKRITKRLGKDIGMENLSFPEWGFGIKIPLEGWHKNLTGRLIQGGTFHIYKHYDSEKDRFQYIRFNVECMGKKTKSQTINQYLDLHYKQIVSMVRDIGDTNEPEGFVKRKNKKLEGYDCTLFEFSDPKKMAYYLEHYVIVDSKNLIVYKFKSYSSGYFENIEPGSFGQEVVKIVETIKFDNRKIDSLVDKIEKNITIG